MECIQLNSVNSRRNSSWTCALRRGGAHILHPRLAYECARSLPIPLLDPRSTTLSSEGLMIVSREGSGRTLSKRSMRGRARRKLHFGMCTDICVSTWDSSVHMKGQPTRCSDGDTSRFAEDVEQTIIAGILSECRCRRAESAAFPNGVWRQSI